MSDFHPGLVHIRTPTFRRPAALRRALQSMIDQSWPHWVCDVYDDDAEESGRAVVESLGDTRIRYTGNRPQLFASRNIDQCFSASNPHRAEYFCVVEDDNFILPDFCAANIALAQEQGVEIVLRNQLIEQSSGTPEAHVGATGVLDDLFTEGRYSASDFRLSLLAGIGVSNGGLFWSVRAASPLEIQYPCTATLQEYLRTYSIVEPIYVALTPLAVWAENAEQTTRNAELASGYLRRELDLKRAVQDLRRKVWMRASPEQRARFMTDPRFAAPVSTRAIHLGKALIGQRLSGHVSTIEAARLRLRGLMIRSLGRVTPEFRSFVLSRDGLAGTGGR
ncbi:glycosyltransferase [Devosia sp. XJ19-1]|uniref:Glycosyltransferase n=1 Tax=Devosia ureilytica TaxID=2952754 RepID=A0A9Q4AQ13_9HYPH|nr:glycosyltransferase [Devosia ureilytica]MCP8884404.1 glycosyltransferase [Devosia ureilytica]MCP8888012.1 glycosyltransferase [Devosia ureilytica]